MRIAGQPNQTAGNIDEQAGNVNVHRPALPERHRSEQETDRHDRTARPIQSARISESAAQTEGKNQEADGMQPADVERGSMIEVRGSRFVRACYPKVRDLTFARRYAQSDDEHA